MMRGLVLLLALVATTTGCVKAPVRTEADLEIEAPDRWSSEAETGTIEQDWWNSFGDPRLDELIRIALEQNRDLHAAAARLDRALADAGIAGSELKPTVGLGADASRSRQVFTGLPLPGGTLASTASRVGVSVETAWEVDLWGRIRAGAGAALADVQATDADLQAARLSIAGQTAKVWFAVAEALEQVAFARRSADSFRATAERVRARYRAGTRPAVDLRLALSNWESAEAAEAARKQQLDFTIRQLEVLIGSYPAGSLLERFSASQLPDTPSRVPAGLPSELLARRPDLVAAERRLAASDQRLVSARKALYPRLTLTASGGSASNQLGDLLDGDFGVWNLLAGLTAPIYAGGRLRAGVDRAEAITDQAVAEYAGSVLRAYGEVEFALASEDYLADQEQRVAETVRQLVAAERLAQQRYEAGIGDYLTVLDSQTRSFVAQTTLIELRRTRLENRIDLFLALGGGFEPVPDDPRVPAIEGFTVAEGAP